MAKVLNIYAVNDDLPDLFAAIGRAEPVVWHWLAQDRGCGSPLLGTANSFDAFPDLDQPSPISIELCGTLPGTSVIPRRGTLTKGGEFFRLSPIEVRESIWFQWRSLNVERRMVQRSRFFVSGAEPKLTAALKAAEKYLKTNGVRPLVLGKTEHATWVLPGAACLAREGWRMNHYPGMPEFGDCKLPS
jgi:hypothetical protein